MISVIIPVYNHTEELIKSLASLEKQTYSDLEVIVVDDGAEIKLQTPITKLQTVLVRQDHKGAPAARNYGFSLSKGEYVIFWDADVIAEPDMLQKMFGALDAHPEASYSYSNFYFGRKKMPAGPFNADRLRRLNYITTTSLMRRKDFMGFDESLKKFQDWDLWLTLMEHNKIGIWVPEYLFTVLPHKGGMSAWLPSFMYRAPFKHLPFFGKTVKKYEEARKKIVDKHSLGV